MACLKELGYAATTTTAVFERAGVARGAGLHHFPSRADLLLETALYIIDSQNEYRAGLRPAAQTPRERLFGMIDVVWASWERPHALALLELAVGARSDPELSQRYPAIQKQIEEKQRERFWEVAKAAGITDREACDRLVVLSVSVMRGLAIERMATTNPARVQEAYLMFRKARDGIIEELLAQS